MTKYNIFSSGEHCANWRARNCDGCRKCYREENCQWHCDLEQAISEAAILGGTVNETVAQRIGYLNTEPRRFA